jgi:hypothetical protein
MGMADSENPAPPVGGGFGVDLAGVGTGAAQWIKSLGSPRAPVSPGAAATADDGGHAPEPHTKQGTEKGQAGKEGLRGFLSGASTDASAQKPSHTNEGGHNSSRLSTRPSFDRDSQKRFAMPCLTLREDTRGNVTLFGMEPGGSLQRLGTVRSGDIIVEVDGKPALGRTEKMVRGLLVGEKGTACTIHWIAPDKVGIQRTLVEKKDAFRVERKTAFILTLPPRRMLANSNMPFNAVSRCVLCVCCACVCVSLSLCLYVCVGGGFVGTRR